LRRRLTVIVRGAALAPEAPDEGLLLALAREHRVDALLAWRTGTRRDEVRGLAVVDALRSREIARVVQTLAAVPGAQPLLFKGAALAHTIYPVPWLRPRLDTDILIAPASTAAAFDALAALGYTRETSTSGALVISQAPFTRVDERGVTHALDVHWQIANWQLIARAASHAELASRAIAVAPLGPAARAIAHADALLIACLHRAAHHRDSEELLWLYDIHLLTERLTADDWSVFLARARRAAVQALCHRGLTLAAESFDSPLPAAVLSELAHAHREPSAIYLSKQLRLVDGLMADLRTLPLRHRVRLLAEHLCPPAEYMRQRYGAASRAALLVSYARRIAAGLPRWFVPGVWS